MLTSHAISSRCLALLLTVGLPLAAQSAPEPQKIDLSPIKLRAYGSVSGTWEDVQIGGQSASLLKILCDSPEKAQLTQAKFLSDMQVLPGVQAKTVGNAAALFADGQGYVAAAAKDNTVWLFAAKDEAAFKTLVAEKAPAGAVFTPQVEVPMYLNRWDKYGFRFYYRTWAVRDGADAPKDFDYAQEFDFAKNSDTAGLVFWGDGNRIDTAEGISNDSWWDWAGRAAAARGLPMGINTSVGQSSTPPWLLNRFRFDVMGKMPQFVGDTHKIADLQSGAGTISWNSPEGQDAELGLTQAIVRRYAKVPNVTTFLEPHGELFHGEHDIFLEYGPVADASYQRFLEKEHGTIEALNTAWGTKYTAWNQVKVPEIAAFLGWGPQAFDLTGDWHVKFEEITGEKQYDLKALNGPMRALDIPTKGAPDEWFAADFDDSSWPTFPAPGNERMRFLPKSPAVYRRTFDLPQSWLTANKKTWLYVWSLNKGKSDKARIAVNGKTLSQTPMNRVTPHWEAVDVTDLVKAGSNQVSLRLPKGGLAYRVYLSPDEPLQYPNLAPTRNAQWVDFITWCEWSRVQAAKRGVEMIRQVDANRQVDLMAPDHYADGIKEIALTYGGNFKNTGHMLAFWNDYLPSIMRGADLPFSLEPGGPARTLEGFKKQLGLLNTEGVQGLDYFIHVGDIMWNEPIRKHFEANLRLIKLVGKYHSPKAEVAALYATLGDNITSFPWGKDRNTNLGSGYWEWNVRSVLRSIYESDGLTESSFLSGDAQKYRVIIDTNTSIMDEAMVSAIEKYVREGGIFVTFVQTGRHTPTIKDSWPIERLTGYRVTKIDSFDNEGKVRITRTLSPAPGQDIFTGDWSSVRANGLSLEKIAPEAKDLMMWNDGTVAIGMRPLGKGFIIQVGCKFTDTSVSDRVEPSSVANRPTIDTPVAATEAMRNLFVDILRWQKIAPVPAKMDPPVDTFLLRHFVTNNGLYDVWSIWNQSPDKAGESQLTFDGIKPAWAINVKDGTKVDITNNQIAVSLPPLETTIFLTPKDDIVKAPLDWFQLQRNWWRGTTPAPEKPFPENPHLYSVDLGQDWSFQALKEGEDGSPMALPGVDDSKWEKRPLNIWSFPDKQKVKHAILRKTFTVPASWSKGVPSLWITSWNSTTFMDRGRVWLDGKLIADWSPDGVLDFSSSDLKAGTEHTLAIEIEGTGKALGCRGTAWLWVWPNPTSSIDLAGKFEPSQDGITYGAPVDLPGSGKAFFLRRKIDIPADKAGQNVVVDIKATGKVAGVLINGIYVRRFHHIIGDHFQLDISPYVQFGKENEIEIVSLDGPIKYTIEKASLNFFPADGYPRK